MTKEPVPFKVRVFFFLATPALLWMTLIGMLLCMKVTHKGTFDEREGR